MVVSICHKFPVFLVPIIINFQAFSMFLRYVSVSAEMAEAIELSIMSNE